jgi:outer membrane protein OmpA-like peptidoglycan-associated protein
MDNRMRLVAGVSTCVMVGWIGASIAHADHPEHTLRLEGGGAVAVTSPQIDRFDVGGTAALAYELRPIAWIGIEGRFSGIWVPSSGSAPTPEGFGSYYAPALGLRADPLAGLGVGDLWAGAGGAVVITGELVRPGLDLGLGYDFDVAGILRIGPVVRYHHVFQLDRGPGASDAGIVTFGLAIAIPGTPQAPRDTDSDGLLDPDDRCPREPEDADGFEDADGCPDPDNDADGVLDGADGCVLEPEDADGFEDENGCPDPDDDADGILDASDACPREPETRNGYDDADGCPDSIAAPEPPPPQVAPETTVALERLAERVLFPRNRAQVLGESRPVIRAVIAFLQAHPEITLLRIEAHASEEGTSERNMVLSERRAETVIRLLVAGGIARSRLEAQAFGDQQPEHHGEGEDVHARNRRVSFVVVRADGPRP